MILECWPAAGAEKLGFLVFLSIRAHFQNEFPLTFWMDDHNLRKFFKKKTTLGYEKFPQGMV